MKFTKEIFSLLLFIWMSSAHAGFYVSNGVLYEGNGNTFKIRGINHAHTWYTDKLNVAFSGIAATGANTVRVVLSNGYRWTKNDVSDVTNIINLAKANKLIAILEVHDTTGYGEDSSAASLDSAADYWIELKNELVGQEDYVIINLGNEPFGNNSDAVDWVNDHISAIQRLRSAGINHTIMVDAPNWGQDWQGVMLNNAQSVFNSDPKLNTIFSVHMYEVYSSYNSVNDYISSFTNKGLVLVIGEFASTHKGSDVDEGSIMERSETLSLGYIGWSWSGNDTTTSDLDIVNNWDNNSFSTWGNVLINGQNGIKSTSTLATAFTCGNNCNDDSSGEYPICSSSAVDPDGDGWGWENNQSCIVQDSSDTAPNGYPYCSQESSDPDGDGWGWENNASCVVKDSGADN